MNSVTWVDSARDIRIRIFPRCFRLRGWEGESIQRTDDSDAHKISIRDYGGFGVVVAHAEVNER
jgi:hypothetical protein